MEEFISTNLRLIRSQVGRSSRQKRPEWSNVIYQLPAPIKMAKAQKSIPPPMHQAIFQQRHKNFEFAPITGQMQLPGSLDKRQSYKLVDCENKSFHEQSQYNAAFDDLDHNEQTKIDLDLPVKYVRLVYRDTEDIQWQREFMTPREQYQAKAPFSALPKPVMQFQSPFSPQYEMATIYRHYDFETPGTHGLVYNIGENSSFIDEPPLCQMESIKVSRAEK